MPTVRPRHCTCRHEHETIVRIVAAPAAEAEEAAARYQAPYPPATRDIAVHESAHAVVALHFGWGVREVTIAGRYHCIPDWPAERTEEAEACFILAGWVAEALLVDDWFLSDAHMWAHFTAAQEGAIAFCDECKVARLLHRNHPDADDGELMRLFRGHVNTTKMLLRWRRTVWDAIGRVADALQERGTLEGAEVELLGTPVT